MQQTDISDAITANTTAENSEAAALANLIAKIDSDLGKILASSQASPGLDFTRGLEALKNATAAANKNAAAMASATADLANADGSAAPAGGDTPTAPVETAPVDVSSDTTVDTSAPAVESSAQ